MKRLLLLLVLLVAGCDEKIRITFDNPTPSSSCPKVAHQPLECEYPTVNLEQAFRQSNWQGSLGQGSCVHATMTMLFRWIGEYEYADYWKANNGNGENWSGLSSKFDRAGVRYAFTARENDVSFLQWACDTRRGCGVSVNGGRHMVALVHLDDQRAGILDNNHISEIKWVSRESFISEWAMSGSWAVTPVGTPPSPLPYRKTP